MAKETIDKIINAENNAETIESEARTRALKLISDAEEASKKIIHLKREDAEKKAEKLINDAKAVAEKIILDAINESEGGDDILKAIQDNKAAAVSACLSKLV